MVNKNKKKKLSGRELSDRKKEKLGILIAAIICFVGMIVIILCIVLPLQSGWEDKVNSSDESVSLVERVEGENYERI